MEKFIINGKSELHGEISVSGMKNAALPIIFGTVLVEGECTLENIPSIKDIGVALRILDAMGAEIKTIDETTVKINTKNVVGGTAPLELVGKMRASYYLLGAELGRFNRAYVGSSGGCNFGVRPIDQHVKGFRALGAEVDDSGDYVEAVAGGGLTGAHIYFDVVTVGGTMNIMLAACKAKGTTIIENAAHEPHVVDLANFLNTCGARISGAGTDTIKITGVDSLHGSNYAIIPDMIEAGTYMVAAAATGGQLKIDNVIPRHLEALTAKLREMGVRVDEYGDSVIVTAAESYRPVTVKTMPYPGFPTDMQPQMAVLLCLTTGQSVLREDVWDSRFRYVTELRRLGATIDVDGRTARIEGNTRFAGAHVKACDLRAGAAMIIAALCAEGVTEIEEIYYIERGYDNIISKLRSVGADVRRVSYPDREELYGKAN